jgi:hypothetical protein
MALFGPDRPGRRCPFLEAKRTSQLRAATSVFDRTFAHPLTGRCLRYGRPLACQRDKTTSNQLDLLCKRAVPGRFGVVSTNEGGIHGQSYTDECR